jgi:hypothetical protein
MMKKTHIAALAAGLALAFSAGSAAAQQMNWQAAPSYGSVHLASGFQPDPYNVNLTAGGGINSQAELGAACPGYVASAPDFDLYWTAGSGALPLVISANSEADTTLVVRTPAGEWLCEDDGGFGTFNPGMRIDNPMSGLYDIWVGTYGPNSAPAVLSISELSSY